jgi:hypothetical protein
MARVGRVPEGKPYTVKTILGYFTSWKTILFTLIFSKLPSNVNFYTYVLTLPLNSNATFWKPTCHVICLLAESTQQTRQKASLHCRTNCTILYLLLTQKGYTN